VKESNFDGADKTLSIGIGCKRHTCADQIAAAVQAALGAYPLAAIRTVATIESKADEPGLLEFCARHALPLRIFSRAEVATVSELPTPSSTVRVHLGVDGVCEPCALLAASAGRLLVPKTVLDGVTVAIAMHAATSLTHTTESDSPANRTRHENRSRIASAHDPAAARRPREKAG
jgi:cobalamin biosynthesis protein CbiG